MPVPGDKSITHRALLASLLPGAGPRLHIRGGNPGGAVRALLPALAALGYGVETTAGALTIHRGRLPVPQPIRPHPGVAHWPDLPYLYTEGSSAAARLLVGVLAGAGPAAIVDGDDVLRDRPMDWLVAPLAALGAHIDYLGAHGRLPVAVHGPVLHGGEVTLAVGSAQARAAVLLAAVAAELPLTVHVPVFSRDHTERMLTAFGSRLERTALAVHYRGGRCTVPAELEVPADPSLAAYPVAAQLLGGAGAVRVPDVCLNPTRLGFFATLRAAGADIAYVDERRSALGEPVGTIVARGGLTGVERLTVDDPATLHAAIDEVPLLVALAAALPGESWLGCAGELRFKETDRLRTSTAMAAAFGADVAVVHDGIRVRGGRPLRAGTVPGFEDHRVAMAAATLAGALPGRTTVLGGACHRTSFPGFAAALRAAGAVVTEDGS
ncbi:3-phosphoshikimate 1-carboxyvinyltransferase [Dactylosporangium vinaceum]